jgi:hypothetical protein
VSINKQLATFQKYFGVIAQLCQGDLKDVSSFQMSQRAAQLCVARDIFP